MAYFERLGDTRFRATSHVGGAWDPQEQHVAPALGLLAHLVETDRDARRGPGLVLGRVSYDILGTMPVGEVEAAVRVVRPGRTIELVEATLNHAGRDAVRLRAWLMQPGDTTAIASTSLPKIPGPDQVAPWDGTEVWPAEGFVASAELRRSQVEPGRAIFWVRTPLPLIGGEDVSLLANAISMLDLANGMTVRAHPRELAFPNIDLTAHFFETPVGEWIGFNTYVSFGAGGVGETHSLLYDERGPIGTSSQILTLREKS